MQTLIIYMYFYNIKLFKSLKSIYANINYLYVFLKYKTSKRLKKYSYKS